MPPTWTGMTACRAKEGNCPMDPNLSNVDFRDFWHLAPAIVLSVWGLVVLLADLALAGRMSAPARRRAIGWLTLAGVALALLAAAGLMQVQRLAQAETQGTPGWLSPSLAEYFSRPGGAIFLGTLSADLQTGVLNVLFILMLGLVVWLSMAWSFTEDWGEYFALVTWATVGMMLLAASEELVTLFLTLETMTICLYLTTAFEKTRRRSAEGGLKYFVYGSVSSALFLFGLSLLYGLTGTTQFEAIRTALASTGGAGTGLSGNVAGATALLLMLVGFGFKIAAVPFHPWAHPSNELLGPGWLGVIAIVSAATMTYGNFAALAQRNFKRMLAYSSIANAGYMLVGVAAASVSTRGAEAAGSVLFYLVVYAFANIGAFAVAAWLVRQALHVHGSTQPATRRDPANADGLGGAGAHELGGLRVLLYARAQGHVPPRARRVQAAGPCRPVDRDPDRDRRAGRHLLRHLPGPSDLGHAGRGRAHADHVLGRVRCDGLGSQRNRLRTAASCQDRGPCFPEIGTPGT